ncbi:hypothetical protein RRU94_16630 [Domibacillus sp. DTU_2020_1001157_1_SI_ALB_TIR_016]|uniref:hypothetical protein n=1 Tax=Domibacillus sp. DTU_2020_1001157_1_SI_ALB_TIR_016 TaxID=3077789 RepID=UPI0028E98CDE|nr:hypothetical protein [Domibacillus sp. DTU_2020_1001157_1_SI_ALB_TIR_016]WNS79189.1 hypothetical protein RRU94_16630 [Domibacillus sp. DTU_2020_1001157_1_SI_ALB_TIR_016]
MFFWWSFVLAIGLALLHFFSKNMAFLSVKPRSRFLSIAGGIAVAYVFIHLLPELHRYQNEIEEEMKQGVLGYIDNHILFVSLLGLVVFYGLERLVKVSKRKRAGREANKASAGVFWLHMASFFLYNMVIGYLLIREDYESIWGMFFFFLAMGVHFVINDHSLREAHEAMYDRYGRLLLTAAILIGWCIGAVAEVNELIISLLVAFIAGGVILNVMKEELPEERESSFGAFSIGIAAYTALLLLI